MATEAQLLPQGVALVLNPRQKDLGGFSVRRILPAPEMMMIGPFIFFDHIGPVDFAPGEGIDVRPHPHVCLATVTYLFAGEIVHRDSLGFEQVITPGAVNWMTAGRGIVHSERTALARRRQSHRLHGIQSWVALPAEHEETEPRFVHHSAASLPRIEQPGERVTLIVGQAYGRCSPVAALSETLYLEVDLDAGTNWEVPEAVEERGLYVVAGEVAIDTCRWERGALIVLEAGATVRVAAKTDVKLMVLGGAPLGPRLIWWNFVTRSTERMERAKADWRSGRFPKVPGEVEFIPLPE